MALVPDITSRPKPFRAAAMAGPSLPLPAPESGTLPGEEQVTTRDVLARLSPPEQAALQRKYETGGHSNTLSYDDWLSENFGELPPKDRDAAMRASAKSTPRINISKDPSLRPGTNTALATSVQAADKPLPEGRELGQYTPEQRRVMSRNVANPEVPMTPFGGTFTHNPNGSVSARAPDPQSLRSAEAIAQDQEYGSPSHIAALAQAYGIDAIRYGDDLDLLRAHTLQEHERHSRLQARMRTVPTGMGAHRYTPNEATRAYQDQHNRQRFAETILRRFGPTMADSERDAVMQLAGTANGYDQMRALHKQLELRRAASIADRVADDKQNYNLTQTLRNPNKAPGMQVRSLLQAVRENNPLALSVQQGLYGNQQGAMQAMQLAAQREHDAAAVEQAGIASGDPKPKTQAGQLREELDEAFANSNPADRYTAVRNVVVQLPGNQNLTEPELHARTMDLIAGRMAASNPADPAVQNHLQTLARTNKPAFLEFVARNMNLSPTQAEEYHKQVLNAPDAYDRGRAIVSNIGDIASGVANFFRGVGGAEKPK